MVNEINKPPKSENRRLGEQLTQSTQQLQAMQEEHQRLVEEMNMLRQRAADLSRLHAMQLELHTSNNNDDVSSRAPTNHATDEGSRMSEAQTVAIEESSDGTGHSDSFTTQEPSATPNSTQEPVQNAENTSEHDNDEDPAYIRDKLAEIETLKQQYRRVQNMINTTNMIEEHLKSKEKPSSVAIAPAPLNDASGSAPSTTPSSTTSPNPALKEIETNDATTTSEKEELLSAMMNMFTDFTSDLRNQAESLRAERERIRELKENILNRKKAH